MSCHVHVYEILLSFFNLCEFFFHSQNHIIKFLTNFQLNNGTVFNCLFYSVVHVHVHMILL